MCYAGTMHGPLVCSVSGCTCAVHKWTFSFLGFSRSTLNDTLSVRNSKFFLCHEPCVRAREAQQQGVKFGLKFGGLS